MRFIKISLAAASILASTACAGTQDAHQSADHTAVARTSNPPAATFTPARPQFPPDIAQQRLCGAFIVIDKLADDIIAPPPDPGPSPTGRPIGELITVANALNTFDRDGLSKAMNAAISAHVHALTYLGTLIDRTPDPSRGDDIEMMTAMVGTTGDTVRDLCQR